MSYLDGSLFFWQNDDHHFDNHRFKWFLSWQICEKEKKISFMLMIISGDKLKHKHTHTGDIFNHSFSRLFFFLNNPFIYYLPTIKNDFHHRRHLLYSIWIQFKLIGCAIFLFNQRKNPKKENTFHKRRFFFFPSFQESIFFKLI